MTKYQFELRLQELIDGLARYPDGTVKDIDEVMNFLFNDTGLLPPSNVDKDMPLYQDMLGNVYTLNNFCKWDEYEKK